MSARLGIQKEPGLVSKSFWMKKKGNLVVYQIISQHVEPNNPSGPHGPWSWSQKKSSTWGSNWPWNKATKPTKMIVQGNKHVVLSSNTGTKLVWNSASKLPYIAKGEFSPTAMRNPIVGLVPIKSYMINPAMGVSQAMGVPQNRWCFSDGTS
jgi:hypothetical protein